MGIVRTVFIATVISNAAIILNKDRINKRGSGWCWCRCWCCGSGNLFQISAHSCYLIATLASQPRCSKPRNHYLWCFKFCRLDRVSDLGFCRHAIHLTFSMRKLISRYPRRFQFMDSLVGERPVLIIVSKRCRSTLFDAFV